MEARQDILLGLLFLVLGLAVVWQASSYSGASGTYPLVLGLAIAVVGALISLRATLARHSVSRELVQQPLHFALACVACIAYVALVVPLGFYTASALLMLFLPLVLGFRKPLYLILLAAGFIALVYIVFSIVLEKPLPAEIWSVTRLQGG